MDKTKLDALREKRIALIESRKDARLRASHGPALAAIVASATGKPIGLDDFHPHREDPMPFDWPGSLADAPGLVATSLGKRQAHAVLACLQETLGTLDGAIGFHDKRHLGMADLRDVAPTSLLAVAEVAEESVLFYLADARGVLMVDCYVCPPFEPFNVVVQGAGLIDLVRGCFDLGYIRPVPSLRSPR